MLHTCSDYLDELKKLEAEGFGRYVDRTEMQKDKILPANNCYSVFIKRDILDLPEKFFTLANSSECTQDMYITNYDKQMDVNSKKVTAVYHGNKDRLMLSVDSQMSDSNNFYFVFLKKYTREVFVS